MNNNKLDKLIQKVLIIIYSLIGLGIIILSVNNNILLSILLITFLIIIYLITKKYNFKINKILENKKLFLIILIIPLLIRLLLLVFNYPELYSDEATFYNNAVAISGNKSLTNEYIATFPYLYPYIYLLGIIFKIFGTNYKVVVLTNIIIDLIGSFITYKFFENIKDKKSAKISLLIWLYNPFQIIWNVKCLPVIIVNTLIILSLYIFSILYKKISNIKHNILFSIILGIVLSIANSNRPIMIIFIIALFIYYVYLLIIKKNKPKELIISFVLIFVLFEFGNILTRNIVSDKTEYEVAKSSGGWSLYLGSSYDTSGQWYPVDKFGELIYSDDFTPTKTHDYFQKEAIKRYKDNGINNLILIPKKANVLVSSFDEFSVNNLYSKLNIPIPKIIINILSKLFWLTLILTNLFIIKLKKDDIIRYFPYLLFFIGVILASLLVEVSPRYFTPNLVVLTIGMTLFLSNNYIKERSD